MTPREEAKELIDKFKPYEPTYFKEKHAKKCALICVDKIIKLNYSIFQINPIKLGFTKIDLNYWQEVKQEIEKL